MMDVVDSVSGLCQRLRCQAEPVIIGIEGFGASGKSYLTRQLAVELNAVSVHTDELTRHDVSLPYSSRIDTHRLLGQIRCGSATDRCILIKGICLRETLRRVNIGPKLFVYVKRLAKNGLWNDSINLDEYESDESRTEAIAEPERSDIVYHLRERPHEIADIVYHRIEA